MPAEVVICGQDCTRQAQWVNAKRIVCVSGDYVGTGEVIITTRSGGRGTCSIRFRGLPPPVKDSEYVVFLQVYQSPRTLDIPLPLTPCHTYSPSTHLPPIPSPSPSSSTIQSLLPIYI